MTRARLARDTLIAHYDAHYQPERKFTRLAMDLLVERVIEPHLRGTVFAELGISSGVVSTRLARYATAMHLVDANPSYCTAVRRRLAGRVAEVAVHAGFFDDIELTFLNACSDVFLLSMVHVLPGQWQPLIERVASCLTAGSRLHITLSNRLAPNRLLGYHMGLIEDLDAVDAQGRLYDTAYVDHEHVVEHLGQNGLETLHVEGFLCRPLPIGALDPVIDRHGMRLLYEMGRMLPPRLCNSTYLCAER